MPREHLLVIDDSPTLLKVVEIALTKAGYKVDTAADGNAGFALVREASTVPDLILLDGMIPGSDPVEICMRLAGEHRLARVPVVVMATKGDDLETRFAKAPNVVDYISKPFTPEALEAVVSHVVQERSPGAAEPPRDAPAELLAEGDALAGNLSVIALVQVFGLLEAQRQTGSLRVENGVTGARVEVFFQGGRIDFATGEGLGEELAPEQALARQVPELVFELLRWTRGRFRFRPADAGQLPAAAREAALGLHVDRLLLEGARRVDEWGVIEREIPGLDEVLVREEHKIAGLPRGTFTRDELAVLELVNGRNSVRETVRALRMGSFDVSKVLFRLVRAQLVRRRVPAVATESS
jgi:DNA-binding response OmpR family regulator